VKRPGLSRQPRRRGRLRSRNRIVTRATVKEIIAQAAVDDVVGVSGLNNGSSAKAIGVRLNA